jgi:hypothetical protein
MVTYPSYCATTRPFEATFATTIKVEKPTRALVDAGKEAKLVRAWMIFSATVAFSLQEGRVIFLLFVSDISSFSLHGGICASQRNAWA